MPHELGFLEIRALMLAVLAITSTAATAFLDRVPPNRGHDAARASSSFCSAPTVAAH